MPLRPSMTKKNKIKRFSDRSYFILAWELIQTYFVSVLGQIAYIPLHFPWSTSKLKEYRANGVNLKIDTGKREISFKRKHSYIKRKSCASSTTSDNSPEQTFPFFLHHKFSLSPLPLLHPPYPSCPSSFPSLPDPSWSAMLPEIGRFIMIHKVV